jgi:ligand-binding sensor domain-containing protein
MAQDMAIGQWQSHLPYNTAVSIATDGARIYVATKYGFYIHSIAGNETTPYSKVNGMSDLGMSKIAYDEYTGTVILAYENSNIDLFKDGVFYNIPDLKLRSVAGTKRINHIITEEGLAYLSTDVGVVVLNLSRNEVKETYTFTKNSQTIPIHEFAAYGSFFYAATNAGLYRAPKNSPNLQAFQAWEAIDSTHNFTSIIASNNKLFIALPDSLFVLSGDTLQYIYSADSSIISLQKGIGSVWVMEFDDSVFRGKARRMNMDYVFTDSFETGLSYELIDVADPDSAKWISNTLGVLRIRKGKGEPYNTIPPQGPSDVTSYDIYVRDKEILVAHGSYDDRYNPLDNGNGFSVYKEGEWDIYRRYQYPPFGDSVVDFVNIIKGPDGSIYAGSTQSGLFILKPDGTYEYYKQNSFIDPSSTGTTLYRISGLAFDNDGVLWATVLGGNPNELVARTTDGRWHKFSIPFSRNIPHSAAHLVVDDNNQKWFAAPSGGGVIVYDDNRTPDNPVDDAYVQLLAGEGSGGLPDNEVYSLANDKTGSIWIGTANGIGIVNCPSQVIQRQCEAEKRVVQFDQFAGYLFQNEQVRAIAVDGANRKWIGTNNGVWLVSPNGDEIIERFTKDNSPLPSDIIQKITIDPGTGDVYIGTELGLMSYRGQAIDGGEENSELVTYPNPVPSGYSGTIAIKGFVENADVRITDISGQLIYRTTALGGQAVWNGKDYTGRRPQSGVYLIFGTNRDGTQTVKGKMVFME